MEKRMTRRRSRRVTSAKLHSQTLTLTTLLDGVKMAMRTSKVGATARKIIMAAIL